MMRSYDELIDCDLDAVASGDATAMIVSILATNGFLEGSVQGGTKNGVQSAVQAVGNALAGLGGHKPS